ncbi:MAG: hypothetical protein AAFY24_02065 [Pseudomonadota bacterium]
MAAKKQKHVHLMSPVPLVPVGHFEKLSVDLDDAWHLVSPTIRRNMHNSNPQQLYCIAFIEGMRMAIFGMQDRPTPTEVDDG